MSAVTARKLSLWYGDFQALFDVDVELAEGRITALVGPSGCGKTTLLKCMNRLHDRSGTTRTTGELLVLGQDVFAPQVSVQELRREVGLVFQRPNPLPLTVFDNVAYALRLFETPSRPELERRVCEALERVELWGLLSGRLETPALRLSLEQQQRLCIARLLPLQPRVLLMDEPCSALDPRATAAVEAVMRSLRGDFTVVVVTHSMAQARRVADDCVFMLQGRVVESGPTEQLFTAAQAPATRDYLAGKFG